MTYPIKIFCDFLSFDLEHQKEIELYVNDIPLSKKPEDVIRFVYLIEPVEIQNLRNKAVALYKKTYDFLLTHDSFLLEVISGSFLLEFGSSWIKDYSFPEKDYSLSFVCGGKNITQGHALRKEIWEKENIIKNIDKNFYISGNFSGDLTNPKNYPRLGKNKNSLFTSQFHICIENSKQKNFFTEKLIDSLFTKTVPIYYGCENISNWFDTRGFFIINSLDDLIKVTQTINKNTYNDMLPYIEENYNRSIRFVDFNKHVKSKIVSIIKELSL